jgi:hypothetical protein
VVDFGSFVRDLSCSVHGFVGAQARDAASCKAAVREAHRAEREREKARASSLKRDAAAKALDDKVGAHRAV